MILLNISVFLGRFHPLLVHLPIGILILGVVLHWVSNKKEFNAIRPAVALTLLLGVISAILSCISGWLLALDGEYETTILDRHRWMGIGVALIATLYYLIYTKKIPIRTKGKLTYILSLVLLLLLFITGHLGGTLTHGEGYLSLYPDEEGGIREVRKVIPDVQEAMTYSDIIQPILQNKCYSCHGPSKQKGKLRLDSKDAIENGGEDGGVLVAGRADESSLYTRLLLDALEKKHMPPKGKPQPSEAEITLIHWWIKTGASFNQPVKALPQEENIKPVLLALQSDKIQAPEKPDVPEVPVVKAPEHAVNKLKDMGVTIVPVAEGSNYLSVNFLASKDIGDADLKLLEPIAPQLVWLKLNKTAIGDSAMHIIAKLPAVTRLHLDHTQITDEGLAALQALSQLQYLNIAGTKVTANGLQILKGLPNLRSVYFYKSNISTADWQILKQAFPKTTLDTGGYFLPILEGDTSLVTLKKKV